MKDAKWIKEENDKMKIEQANKAVVYCENNTVKF